MKESEAMDLGCEYQRDIDLMRDFYMNAEVRVSGGPMGRAVGLPIGCAEIRCAHAPHFGLRMIQASEFAVEFYEANCIDCHMRSAIFSRGALDSLRNTRELARFLARPSVIALTTSSPRSAAIAPPDGDF